MSEHSLEVRREEERRRSRSLRHRSRGGVEAEMTYRKTGSGPMTIDHTGVPPAFEGRGIASKLVHAAIADARAEGFTIHPVCSLMWWRSFAATPNG